MFARPLNIIQTFFQTWRFPVFTLVLIACYEVLLAGLLFLPAGDGALESFAEEFRVWCFGYDPATGKPQWLYIVTTFLSPLVLASVVLLTWANPLRHVLRRQPVAIVPYGLAALLLTIVSASLLTTLGGKTAVGPLPFPADSLRTSFHAPEFTFTNQDREQVTLSKLRGRVVVITAVYSTCGFT
jgi:protein SCO1